MSRYGYWVDLGKQQLFDSGNSSWVHAFNVGTYDHPVYGQMEFTPDKLQAFATGVKNNIRGIALDIDYDHKQDPAKGDKAAGWVRDAEVRDGNALWLQVDWTEPAAAAIKAGEYRYFSPEFDDEWADPAGLKHKDVLFGGALTNRPFLKDLMPVNLSEITNQNQPLPKGGTLDPKKLREMLKLAEGASDDEVTEAIKKLSTQVIPGPPKDEPPPTPAPVLDESTFSKMLAEHPMFKELQGQLSAAATKLAEAERARAFADTRSRLAGLQTTQAGRQYVLPPAVIDAIANGSVESDPVKMSEGFLTGLEQLVKTGYVELGERGRMGQRTEKDASTMLGERVAAVQQQHFQATGRQLRYTDAVRRVAAADPELYLSYREDSYAGKED